MMKDFKLIRILFYSVAVYDFLLGGLFLVFPTFCFTLFGIPLPNHLAYVQFPACLLITFALMFIAIAKDPICNRNLIPYGTLLKVSYCGIAFKYWFTIDIPTMWKPFAIIDFFTIFLFIWAFVEIGKISINGNKKPNVLDKPLES